MSIITTTSGGHATGAEHDRTTATVRGRATPNTVLMMGGATATATTPVPAPLRRARRPAHVLRRARRIARERQPARAAATRRPEQVRQRTKRVIRVPDRIEFKAAVTAAEPSAVLPGATIARAPGPAAPFQRGGLRRNPVIKAQVRSGSPIDSDPQQAPDPAATEAQGPPVAVGRASVA